MNIDFSELLIHRGTDPSSAGRVFIVNREDDGGLKEYTYGQLYRRSLEYGNMISRVRAAQGKADAERFHVGVFMQNRPEFFFILGGCAFTNSTLVGINNAQLGEKLAFDINNIDVDVLIVDNARQPGTETTFAGTVTEARDAFGFPGLADEFILSEGETDEDLATVGSLLERYGDSLHGFAAARLDAAGTAMIIFTSGTTGAPKGIEVTWDKLIDVGITGTAILDYNAEDVGYVCMPLNHSNSLYLNVMPALINGAKIMLRRRFSSSNFVKDLADSAATVWNSVGDPVHYVLNYLGQQGSTDDLARLPIRTVISTGANSHDRKSFTEIFGLDIFTEIFGSTEAGAITAVDEGSPDYSVGRLIKDVRVVSERSAVGEAALASLDGDDRISNMDESAGEIVVSQQSLGGSRFAGYYRLGEESAKRIIELDGQDFYRMGDLGAIVSRGGEKYLVFLGRTGDWIRFKGENWSPVDAERIVMKFEDVRNAGIIGLPQSEGKEDDPMFVIEPSELGSFDVEGFLGYCDRSLPHYMQPRFVRLIEALPMTDTMKVVKTKLRSDFICRAPDNDGDPLDVIYEVRDGQPVVFTATDYRAEMKKYTDPTNKDRLVAFTRRPEIFEDL